MLTAKKIKCRPRSVGQRNWAAQFERWLGYPLHRDARRAMTAPPPEKEPGPTGPTLSDPSFRAPNSSNSSIQFPICPI